jgi:hypothetical protein
MDVVKNILSSSEMCWRHIMNVFCQYNLWDIWRSKIFPNYHIILVWKIFVFHIFLAFFCASYQKSCNLYGTN